MGRFAPAGRCRLPAAAERVVAELRWRRPGLARRRWVTLGTARTSQDRLLDAVTLRDWAHTAVSDLITHIDEINRLNVFPVADSDTGANMLFTMRSALAEAHAGASAEQPPDP